MSFDWFNWAKGQKGLRPPEQFILLLIADFYNDKEGYAWPSQETLAEFSGYNRSTIHRACKSLQSKGLISWKKDIRSSGHFSSNRYQLHRVALSNNAENVEAEKAITVLPKASPPCCTEQQKHLAEPLKLTLNSNSNTQKTRVLSESQKKFAEKLTEKLLKMHPNQYYLFDIVYKDCCDFLLTDQHEEDWINLGNGLPNPLKI